MKQFSERSKTGIVPFLINVRVVRNKIAISSKFAVQFFSKISHGFQELNLNKQQNQSQNQTTQRIQQADFKNIGFWQIHPECGNDKE